MPAAPRPSDNLRSLLHALDGRGYKAYRDIQGAWAFPGFVLHIDHVQRDPYAAPTRARALLPPSTTQFEPRCYANTSRAVGLTSFLARQFAARAHSISRNRGTGHSGEIRMERPGQEVLRQTAVQIADDGAVEARFTVGLPAQGRRVLGRQAAELFLHDLPQIIDAALRAEAYTAETLWRHAAVNEDADTLRAALPELGLTAFVADGAVLPRRSGVDDRPLQGEHVVRFVSPPSLRVQIRLPHAGLVSGMGVPAGVTLIVGGGYHGKSTLLRAIERGVYNHLPGDGREQVVSLRGLVKIRAEDGRSVAGVDISPFIDNLPLGQSTRAFVTANASGSTSQAAAIMEALEADAEGLLIDEDTAATNFMIRDSRMQALVPKSREPIIPFIDRVRQLYDDHGVSTVLVIGGSGDYLDVADTVIAMDTFLPQDVTEAARQVARERPTGRQTEAVAPLVINRSRRPQPESLDPSRGRRDVNIKTRGPYQILFGEETLDLSAVEQIVASGQTRAIANAIWYARQRYMDGNRTIAQILDQVAADIERHGLDLLDSRRVGDLAEFRKYELAAAINRLRSLRVRVS